MPEIISTDLGAFVPDPETGEPTSTPVGPVRRAMTAAEVQALNAVRAETAAEQAAEALDVQRRAQRRALIQSLGAYATPTWAQVETTLTAAIDHERRTVVTQWTNALMVDAIRMVLRMALFLVARELRRVADNREPD